MEWDTVDADSPWSEGAGGIYHTGRVAIGTSATQYDQQLRIESNRGIGLFVDNTSSQDEVTAIMGRTNNSWQGIGVWGSAGGEAATGVYGLATGSSAAWGIWGKEYSSSSSAMAGWFTGNVHVNGTLTASNKDFKIDHPLDPENKYLYHSCVESDEMMNVYSGTVRLDSHGKAVVTLPNWFGALNRDYRYQLTCIGGYAPVYIAQEIADSQFTIAGGTPELKVSWQVTGIRDDAYARAHPMVVEEEKPPSERGSYLNPEAYGQPRSRSIEHALHPEASALGE
jgi:hypothetical protein